MSFNNSPFRSVLTFRRIFIGQNRSGCDITRAQVIFLAYLIESGHCSGFTVRQTMIPGLSWALSNQYLNKLKRIGFAVRQGRKWTITPAGTEYYGRFASVLNAALNGPLQWK